MPVSHRFRQVGALSLVLSLGSTALAAVSLVIGGVLLGFDQIQRHEAPSLHGAARDLIGDYSRQLGMSCAMTEVFHRENTFLPYGMTLVDTAAGYGSVVREISSSPQQIIFVIYKRYGTDVLGVLYRLDDGGALLIVCN